MTNAEADMELKDAVTKSMDWVESFEDSPTGKGKFIYALCANLLLAMGAEVREVPEMAIVLIAEVAGIVDGKKVIQ